MPRLKVSIATDSGPRMCSRHPTTPATAIRITTTTRKLLGVPAQTIRRPECAECARKPVSGKNGVSEKVKRI